MVSEIVSASVRDIEGISRLAHEIWPVCYAGIISREQIAYMLGWMYSVERMTGEITREGILYDRLFVDGKLVGFVSYGPDEKAGALKIHKLYLHPDHQRKGYGSLLLEHVETFACKNSYCTLTLRVNRNNHAAVAAYRRNGFVVAGSDVTDIGNGYVMDDYIMEKAIG